MNDIKSINKTNIVDEVFNQLEKMIVTGKWEPGHKIPSETELASLMSVSRNTLRSALQKLKGMGAITTRQGQGTFVAKTIVDNIMDSIIPLEFIENEELLELIQFRRTVELGSVYKAAENRTPEQIKKIEDALHLMEQNLDNYVEHAKADYKFHVAVAEASGNRYYLRMYKSLKTIMYEHFLKMSHDLGTDISIDAHKNIFEAIKNGDAEMAQLLTRRNIDKSLNLLEAKE